MGDLNNKSELEAKKEDVNSDSLNQFNTKKPKVKHKNLKYILSLVFLGALIAVTIIVLATRYNLGEVFEVIGTVDYTFLVLGVSMILLYIFFQGVATKLLFKTINRSVGLWPNVEYAAIDYYFSIITPSATGGQPMVMYYMKKDGISVAESPIILLMNTALYKIVLMLLSLIALIMYPNYVTSKPLLLGLFIFGFAFNFIIVFLCFLATFRRKSVQKLGELIIKLLHKMHIVKNYDLIMCLFNKKMDEYEQAANLIKQNKLKYFGAFMANLLQRVSFFMVSYFVYLSFCKPYPEIANFNFFNLMSIQIIIAISVDSLPFPGGVGISEILFIYLYEFIYGTEALVLSAVMVTRALNFYIPLLITMSIFIYKHVSNIIRDKKKNKEGVLE